MESQATGISPTGLVVGSSQTATGLLRAFLWKNGVMRNLHTLNGGSSAAFGVNAGKVVGNSDSRAFLWAQGVMTDLGALGGSFGEADAINVSGQVVGESETASGQEHATLWT